MNSESGEVAAAEVLVDKSTVPTEKAPGDGTPAVVIAVADKENERAPLGLNVFDVRSYGKGKAAFKVSQRDSLENFFSHDMYPSINQRTIIATDFGVELQQVTNWFQNRRSKERRNREALNMAVAAAAAAPVSGGGDGSQSKTVSQAVQALLETKAPAVPAQFNLDASPMAPLKPRKRTSSAKKSPRTKARKTDDADNDDEPGSLHLSPSQEKNAHDVANFFNSE